MKNYRIKWFVYVGFSIPMTLGGWLMHNPSLMAAGNIVFVMGLANMFVYYFGDDK